MSEDAEIERIRQRKLEELIRKTRVQGRLAEKGDGGPVILTDTSFSSEVSKYPLMVVDFWAAWCGPCRMVAPIIEQLAREYSGRVAFGKLNVDENPLTSNAFQVQSIPTLLIFKHGKAVDSIIGAVPKYQIESRLKAHLDDRLA